MRWRSAYRLDLTAALAALLVSTAPAFEALAGQALPYVASYSLFVLGLLAVRSGAAVRARRPRPRVALACGLVGGLASCSTTCTCCPRSWWSYGLLRRMPLRNLVLVLVAMALPRWSGACTGRWRTWRRTRTTRQHPAEALAAWFDPARTRRRVVSKLKAYALLAAHGVLNIGAAFLFWPVALAPVRARGVDPAPCAEAAWFVAVAVAGFAPALFMLSTWPHIPRWYAYGFPAVYILAAAAAVRIGALADARATRRSRAAGRRWRWSWCCRRIVLANLDVLGATRPMELLLFQPTHWSYLWSP